MDAGDDAAPWRACVISVEEADEMRYELTRRNMIASGVAAALCGPGFAADGGLDIALVNA